MGSRGPKQVGLEVLELLEKDYANTLEGICYGTTRITRTAPQMPAPPKLSKFDELTRERMANYEDSLKKNYFGKWRNVRYGSERAIGPEPEVWEALKKAKTQKDVREAYSKAGFWKFRLSILRDHPDKFLAAKRSPRYPRSSRPSSEKKRIRYLARAMAGIHSGLSPSTSVALLERFHTKRRSTNGSL